MESDKRGRTLNASRLLHAHDRGEGRRRQKQSESNLSRLSPVGVVFNRKSLVSRFAHQHKHVDVKHGVFDLYRFYSTGCPVTC